jgi:hypothetical protein
MKRRRRTYEAAVGYRNAVTVIRKLIAEPTTSTAIHYQLYQSGIDATSEDAEAAGIDVDKAIIEYMRTVRVFIEIGAIKEGENV